MRSTFPDASRGGPSGPPFSRVVLVGGGHAHLELVRSSREFRDAGIELVLVDPGEFHYSGGASAILGGSLPPHENRIDLTALCAQWKVTHHRSRAASVDLERSILRLSDGSELSFDRLSLDVGSRCRTGGLSLPPGTVEVKPIADLEAFRARLVLVSQASPQRILVIGGGATGVELAGNLLRLSRTLPHALGVTLVSSTPSLLPGASAEAGRIAHRVLSQGGVTLHLSDRLIATGEGNAELASGRSIAFDHLLLATGLVASTEIKGLPATTEEGIAVEATLASPSDRRIFAVGDCAAIAGHRLPKLGVYGVRAAPVLRDNLIASLRGESLRPYRPQSRALSILDLGDGTGLALFGRLVLRGRAMLWWKRRIDRRFLDRYRPD